ncbi:NADP-dependent phosphogluconate dehydrogenase [Aquimarina aggregata]|uniref:NADP-dependent phosphogluconate dehydrogenase n=1 Tax=Aquimarina aggregata TaxID=1642818 RepID=UPI0024909265|nr:NADP-dependent phosphogluconate dehydrogenase [Aquimarina aggregata]
MSTGKVYIVFGVSGCGKSTIGQHLAKDFDIPFYDADDFHPERNIKKMSKGFPLNDDDRDPWLEKIANEIRNWHNLKGAVLACSALKQKYRDKLQSISPQFIEWIFLDGSYDLISNRMAARKDHFFKKEMLVSQFEALQKPQSGITVDINQSVSEIIMKIKSKVNNQKTELGLIGLGVMGKSLAKNLLSKNFSLSVYNRQVANKEIDVAQNFVKEESSHHEVLGFDDMNEFVSSLTEPRTIIMMVNAGKPIDMVIDAIIPFLNDGDCLIDGGNSHYKDTLRREKELSEKGICFLGTGISGGEEGALKGPSIMPGGSKEGYEQSGKFLEAIAAKDKNDKACCTYIGPEGAGHYVKMVHNGIEYAEMQLLAEIYHLLRFFVKKTPDQIAAIFGSWRKDGLDSYLLEITEDILYKKEGDVFLIDKILDKAGQKGTGGWSTIAALDVGVPLSTISESVMARNLSGMKSQRIKVAEAYQMTTTSTIDDTNVFLENLKNAFQAASIINHSIGFDLLHQASLEYNWNLNLSEIARIWTNGCIIRSNLMEKISISFLGNNDISVLMSPDIITVMKGAIDGLTDTVSKGFSAGCSLPVLSSATNYFLTYTSSQSSANIIQAQRDYFGAHTYQRVDKPIDEYFHTNWKS